MNIGMYLGAAALGALERWQDVIARNVSSGATPGYRKSQLAFTIQPAGSMTRVGAPGAEAVPVHYPSTHIQVDFRPGQISGTSRELDVAIHGEGFFEVQLPDGGRAYTRAGSFYLNADRTLVDADGNPVLGAGGAQITALQEGGPIYIARDGTITQGEQQLGTLAVFRFNNPAALQPITGSRFLAPPGQVPQPLENIAVQQGALEDSNVSPMLEMVNLIEVSRAYQAAQKVISSRDETIDKTLRALT